MTENASMRAKSSRVSNRGFSLLETMIAIVVLAVGVLSLAATFAAGITYMMSAQDDFIAQQKAEEAVESIFTARDSNAVPFASIANTANGGIFLGGPQPLCDPGPDGIVGTADDNCNLPDSILMPGPDGILDPTDPRMWLGNFTRTIAIVPVAPGLNQITVTMNYTVNGRLNRQYQLVTNISSSF